MLKITDAEREKLVSLAYDDVAIEALKKFFLNMGLERGEKYASEVNILAAEKLTMVFMEGAFAKLESLKDIPLETHKQKNVV